MKRALIYELCASLVIALMLVGVTAITGQREAGFSDQALNAGHHGRGHGGRHAERRRGHHPHAGQQRRHAPRDQRAQEANANLTTAPQPASGTPTPGPNVQPERPR